MTNPNMHTEGIENGESADRLVATFYNPCTGIINANGYLRVIQDAEGCDMETRIDHETLIASGWSKAIPDEKISDLSRRLAFALYECSALRHTMVIPRRFLETCESVIHAALSSQNS